MRREAAEHQHAAALTHRGLQRGQEAGGQKAAADQPDAGKDRGKRIDAAGRAALLDRLQNLSDGFAIVIGGAAGRARLIDRIEYLTLRACAGVVRRFGIGRRCGLNGRRAIVADRIPCRIDRGVADVERLLNGGERDFGGIFDLLGIVRHVQSEPSLLFTRPAVLATDLATSPQARTGIFSPHGTPARPSAACPLHPQTSYWLSDANEMAAIKTLLIIVNSIVA